MPLTLITGPANAGKAGAVLDAYRRSLDRSPVLVVPTAAAAAHYRRELALRGQVLGGTVLPFGGLIGELAQAVGVRGRPATRLQRERLVAAAIGRLRLDTLAESARAAGFAAAAGDLLSELERALVDPPRLAAALREWAGGDPGRERYGNEVAAIAFEYRRQLDRLGLVDPDGLARRVLEALRADPGRWSRRPVFLYGFDDLTGLQLETLETLATAAGAEVTLGLAHEPGRGAFAARAPVHAELAALADEAVALPARDHHYAPGSREALHHLERGLFEPGFAKASAGDAVRILEAAGERAEVELVAAEVLEALRDRPAPDELAVVFRDPARAAPLLAQVFGAYGVPCALGWEAQLAHTALGRGLLALLRCALPGGTAPDLLAYLRTPGRLDRPGVADRVEQLLRRRGARSAGQAAAEWAQITGHELGELARLRDAVGAGTRPALAELKRVAERLLARPRERRAVVLAEDELSDARAYAALERALSQLDELAAADPGSAPAPHELQEVLSRLEVRLGDPPGAAGVAVLDPLAVRARRWRRLFLCGLQEGEFPRRGAPEPFLPDELRAELRRRAGLRLPSREDPLAAERHLFYECASRAEERLTLSWRSSDEEGNPALPSPFLRDVAALFEGDLAGAARRRRLADVTWPAAEAPTGAELERALAFAGPRVPPEPIAPLRSPAVLERMGEARFSASGLELYAGCPVRWLVERRLRPEQLDPDAEQLVRGGFLHDVLRDALAELEERTGSARVRPQSLEEARQAVHRAIEARREAIPLSPHEPSARAALRRLERELDRWLEWEAKAGGWEPAHLELPFGLDDAELGCLEIGDLVLRGQIDRVEVRDGQAIVRDYKTSQAHAWRRWDEDTRLQVGLYMLAVERLLGLEVVGGLYQPLRGDDLRARGIALRGPDGGPVTPEPLNANDVVDEDELRACLEQVERRACSLAREARAGNLEPQPATCAFRGAGCAHPGICRSVAA